MIKRRAWAVGVAVLAPVVVVGVFLSIALSSMPTLRQKVEEQAELPLLLQPEDYGKGPARGEILLRADGIAVLTDFPVGKVEPTDERCTSWDGVSTFTGEAQWTVDRDYVLRIRTDDGDVAIGPYAPAFGELAWYRFGLPVCGQEEPLWYWRASE